MEPYSTGSRDGGMSPAGTPPPPQGWAGQGTPPPQQQGWAGQGMPGTPPATPGWSGQGTPSTPGWATPNVGVPSSPGAMSNAQANDPKWPALRLIATILKVIAWIEGGIGVIAALASGVSLSATIGAGGFLLALFGLVVVAVGFLFTYAASEIIMLFISIEKNTRTR